MIGVTQIQAVLATAQPERATAFYRDTLGLTLVKEDQFGIVFEHRGGGLRLAKLAAVPASASPLVGFAVADIVAAVDALAVQGVVIERYAYLEQDARGVWTGPDGTRVVFFRDPDANLLSLAQYA